MIALAKPLIGQDEMQAVQEVLASGQLAQGAKVRRFEEQFAEWVGVRHAVAVTSGTAALHLALLAAGIGPEDSVITTPFSFVASANCAFFVGARPVFADIEPDYFTISADAIRAQMDDTVRALIVVHLYGQPCDMDAMQEIARERNLVLIEDACQAHGAAWRGHSVGSMGVGCFSFYPTKNMTTGEGGMVTTDDAGIAERVRLWREHGAPRRYVHEQLGFNLRMTDIQAAIGLVQLGKVDAWNERRRSNAAQLDHLIAAAPGVQTPAVRPNATHVYHQYTIRVAHRDEYVEMLNQRGVGAGIHYSVPIHLQPWYRELGYLDSLPEAESAAREVLSLPVHPGLTDEEIEIVGRAVVEVAQEISIKSPAAEVMAR